MAEGLGIFGKNNRKKERRHLGSILEAFNEMKVALAAFVEEKTGHVARLDTELAKLAFEKQQAAKDMDKAIITKQNIEKLMGEGGNPL